MDSSYTQPTWIAFVASRRLAIGTPTEVATAVKAHFEASPDAGVLIFDAHSSTPVELDTRGTLDAVLSRLPIPPMPTVRTPGRPKLGVVAREVTLLPRHWDWLAAQPGGASVTLRKLVEQAQRAHRQSDQMRQARDAAYRFMHAIAGNESGFEEASRALFADDRARLQACLAPWPADVREHTLNLVQGTGVGL
ncbi:DUF2239 family protein [Leptothrix ochracea]|uniref:DUF2239 family protein n=1 Tax=Leptothrix ochracea TaxID=735331 RepID=UPI0034E298F7